MKKLSTYLLIFFMIMFWVFRVVLAFTNSIGIDMGFYIANINIEVILLFVSLLWIVLAIKRKILGCVGYLITNIAYFGTDMISAFTAISEGTATMYTYNAILAGGIAIILALAVVLDLLLDKNRKNHPKDKKTDWFYKNEQYDRQLDERADKNNYRTL